MPRMYFGPAIKTKMPYHTIKVKVRGCASCNKDLSHVDKKFCSDCGSPKTTIEVPVNLPMIELFDFTEKLNEKLWTIHLQQSNDIKDDIIFFAPNRKLLIDITSINDLMETETGYVSVDGNVISKELEAFKEQFKDEIKSVFDAFTPETCELNWFSILYYNL